MKSDLDLLREGWNSPSEHAFEAQARDGDRADDVGDAAVAEVHVVVRRAHATRSISESRHFLEHK